MAALLALCAAGCGDVPSNEASSPEIPLPVATQTSALGAVTVTLEPVADTQVTPSSPDTNYGSRSAWEVNRQFSLEPNNAWGEYTLTYANRPPPSATTLGSWFIANSNNVPLDRLCVNDSPALIPVVQSASNATGRRVSFRLVNAEGYLTYYYSREYPDPSKHPRLEITY